MRTLDTVKTELELLMPYLREHYHVHTMGIFGSYARNEQKPDSDLDIIVTFTKTPDLLSFIELEQYISDQLGIDVDLGMPDAIKPRIAPHVLDDVVYV